MTNPYRAAGTFAGATYVERDADQQLQAEIRRNSRIPYLSAPRQSGKSSLIVHTVQLLPNREYDIIYIDLSSFKHTSLADYDDFLLKFLSIRQNLLVTKLRSILKASFKSIIEHLLQYSNRQLLMFIDEIDILLHASFRDSSRARSGRSSMTDNATRNVEDSIRPRYRRSS